MHWHSFQRSTIDMTENELSNKITGLAIEVHTAPGPGLLESAYKECFYYKTGTSGLLLNFNVVKLKEGIKKVVNARLTGRAGTIHA